MAYLLKAGVCGDCHRRIRWAIGVIAALYADQGFELVITSIRDGNHSPGSLHYDGRAVDFRPGVHALNIRRALGSDFDVVDEGNHIHVEYDPA